AAARSGILPLAADWEPAATGESAARAGWFWASKNDPVRTTLTIQNRFFMKNPATFKSQPTHRLDADPRPSVFPYSTLGGPSSAEKAQDRAKAGSTGALDGQCLMSGMSHPEPPGWMMAVAPALAISSTPSGKGKKASEAATVPFRGNWAFMAPSLHASTRLICPAPTPTVWPSRA